MDLSLRERIASEVLGESVTEGQTMPCRFSHLHSKPGGARDVRVCLTEDGGKLPTFFCFHSSCEGEWAPVNRELRRRIWFAENGGNPLPSSNWNQGGRTPREPDVKPPGRRDFDLEALKRIYRPELGANRDWFRARSPIPLEGLTPEGFLAYLYQPGERVLVFTKFASQGQFIQWVGHGSFRLGRRSDVKAVPCSELPKGGPEGVWFLCQPVTGKWYPNPRNPNEDGTLNLSRRSMEAVTAWRFMVLESDEAPEDLWLSFLATLPLPISAIYTSGGKSIHALVPVQAKDKAEWDQVKRLFVSILTKLGADSGALSAVRLTRLPGCTRGNREQKLLYLNPSPDLSGTPIFELS